MNDEGRPEARRPTGRLVQVTAAGLTRAVRARQRVGKAFRNDYA